MRDRQHYVVRVSPTNAETKKSQLYIQVPCYRSLYLLRMHTELTLPGEEDIYFGLDKHKHKRGELLVVEEGKEGSFTCVGGGKVGRGAFSSLRSEDLKSGDLGPRDLWP